jgi:antitoxin HicB
LTIQGFYQTEEGTHTMTHNPLTGSDSDDFLRVEGFYKECSEIAIKRVLARQLAEMMKQK